MRDSLSVSSAGLRVASAALNQAAGQIVGAGAAGPVGETPSNVGAASFASAIEALNQAYARRLAGHGNFVDVAADRYTGTDDGSAVAITAVSV